MDKEYIVKHNLMEAHKQFMRLSEGYLATQLSEDGEDDNNEPDVQEMPQIGDDGEDNGNIEEPNAENQEMNTMNDNMPAGNDDEMPGDMSNFGGDVPQLGNDELETDEDDDVLDVEDLTQAQEKLNKKQNSIGHDLGEVDDRIIALLTAVEKIQGSIEKNNSDISALKAELEKRVPTDTEKLNMQSLKMYPFNVSPNEYWNEKEKDGRYEAEDDEKKKEYKITQKDIDDYTDRDIENSFDEKLHQTMKDIFNGF